jgi:D-3-phosphoglycerate dehydrogenase
MAASRRVLISDKFSEKGIDVFRAAKGVTVDYRPDLTADGLLATIAEYDALAVRSKTKVTRAVLAAGKRLQVVGRAGTGVDNIDVVAATQAGVLVMNTPGGNTITTAEHTIAMMLALSRRIPQATASTKAGKWEKSKFLGREVFNKRLGVIGLGNIGRVVAERAKGLGMRVCAFDPYLTDERAAQLGVDKVDLDELLATSDYVTVHTPKTAETAGILNAAAFAKMKKGVMVLNCARGGIVSEKDLAAAIRKGTVAGAALDVFETEPPSPDNPLLALDAVVCTPHLGASTEEAQDNVAVAVAEQILAYLLERRIVHAVNVPSIDPRLRDVLAPYLLLAEKLGRFQSQRLTRPARQIEIEYAGEIGDYEVGPLTHALLQGFMSNLDENVNFVSAPALARERGIRIVETKTKRPIDYASRITARVETEDRTLVVSGAKFGDRDVRIVAIDGHSIEATPQGHLLLVRNRDVPGVVGLVGTTLGRAGVNIASLHLGRGAQGGTAMLVVNLDSAAPAKLIAALRKKAAILDVTAVEL